MLPLLTLLACGPTDPFEEVDLSGWPEAVAPTSTEEADGVVTHEFDPQDGPACLRGEPFRVATRDQGSKNLVIFLQGGGACWEDFCFAIEEAPAGMPVLDVLNTDLAANPVRDWNQLYVPYCDGSLFAGDVDIDDDGDGTPDRLHRGLPNLMAAIRVAQDNFPDAERVLLSGSSGGGYGTILATVPLRKAFPRVPIDVFNDSGTGIAKAEAPDFIQSLMVEWGAEVLVPDSCEGCLDRGHMTPLIDWQLQRDRDLRVAMFSAYGDAIIADLFLRVGEEGFRPALEDEVERLMQAHPRSFAPFLVEGTVHTTLLGSVEGIVGEVGDDAPDYDALIQLGSLEGTRAQGTNVSRWMQAMLDGKGWEPVIE